MKFGGHVDHIIYGQELSMSSGWVPEDKEIVRYLLGSLDEGEAEKIEQLYFCDSAFEEHVDTLEWLLIGDFLEGVLNDQESELFAMKYFRVPALRETVRFAIQLRAAAVQPHRPLDQRPEKSWRHAMVRMAPPAFALVGLLSLVISVLIVQVGRRSEGAGAERSGKTTSDRQIHRVEQSADLQIASLILTPGLAKGNDSGPKRLQVTPEATEIRLELDLPGIREGFTALVDLELVLENGHKQVWTSNKLPTLSTVRGQTVLVILRPDQFVNGDYVAYVKNASATPNSPPLESFVFGVVRH
jgi:hypothetical protein